MAEVDLFLYFWEPFVFLFCGQLVFEFAWVISYLLPIPLFELKPQRDKNCAWFYSL